MLTSLGHYWLCFFDRTKVPLSSIKTIAIPSTYPKPEKGEVAELPVLRPPQITSIRLLKSFALSLKSYYRKCSSAFTFYSYT